MTVERMLHERRRALVGVLFAEDFDAERKPPVPPPAPAPPPSPPPAKDPVYTLADVEAARADGRATGRIETEHSVAAARVQMLGLISHGLEDARAAGTEVAEQAAEKIAGVMLSALLGCLPAVCEHMGETELRAMVRRLLPSLADEPRIALRVNKLMIPAMTEEIAALDSEISERVVLIPSEQIAPGDARMSWEYGSAVRNAAGARGAVRDALAALGLLEQETING